MNFSSPDLANNKQFHGSWAVILGGSSGFGLAALEKLARHGMNIAVLYREMSAPEKILKAKLAAIANSYKVSVNTFNVNALEPGACDLFSQQFAAMAGGKHSIRLLLHSIARGNLKPLVVPENSDLHEILSIKDIQSTTYAMATSLLDWTRSLLAGEHFHTDARIIGLTSEGAHKYWEGYAAVSIAKSSLESLVTYMAVELSKYGLKTNLIKAGITDTPSLKRLPASEELIRLAAIRNPLGRLTRPDDVANVIYLLCTDEASWINGSVIHVDGGEHCR
ncbi:MAG TPA: SDR family oxidoreductase [Puia sp.]|nr:SDR family oxidoreductase [Puia sp.]